jgi:hypothetical protein
MDLMRGVRYPLQDSDWLKKVGIGTLISFVPIFNLAATGYSYDVLRNVYNGRETPLPEWSDLGNNFIRGLIGAVIGFLWALPVLLLSCPLYAVLLSSAANSPTGEPTGGAAAVVGCLGLLVGIVALLIVPMQLVAIARYAVTNNFSEALPGPVLRELRGNVKPWLIVLLGIVGFAVVAGVLAACTFGLGYFLILPLVFYIQLVAAHWYAQAHRESTGGITAPAMVG